MCIVSASPISGAVRSTRGVDVDVDVRGWSLENKTQPSEHVEMQVVEKKAFYAYFQLCLWCYGV